MDNPPTRRDYTQTDLDIARTKGQVIGWVQGGAGVLAGLAALRFLGWVPTLLVAGAIVLLVARLLRGRK